MTYPMIMTMTVEKFFEIEAESEEDAYDKAYDLISHNAVIVEPCDQFDLEIDLLEGIADNVKL